MASDREYTHQKNPNHKLVFALWQKGYTDIKVTWTTAMSSNRHMYGWSFTSKELAYRHIGHSIDSSLTTIKSLPEIKKPDESN